MVHHYGKQTSLSVPTIGVHNPRLFPPTAKYTSKNVLHLQSTSRLCSTRVLLQSVAVTSCVPGSPLSNPMLQKATTGLSIRQYMPMLFRLVSHSQNCRTSPT